MRNGNNGNGNGNNGNGPARNKRVTRDDLVKSIDAARQAAEAAARAAETTAAALQEGPIEDGPGDEPPAEVVDTTPAAPAPRSDGTGKPPAFEQFMASLGAALKRAGDAVQVSENAAWVKIESRKNGHKVYVAKGKNSVNRVESTLPPSAVKGATEPGRPNGRIASWIPADVASVSQAIERLSTEEGQIRPPLRGGGGAAPPSGGAPSGSGSGGGGRRSGQSAS